MVEDGDVQPSNLEGDDRPQGRQGLAPILEEEEEEEEQGVLREREIDDADWLMTYYGVEGYAVEESATSESARSSGELTASTSSQESRETVTPWNHEMGFTDDISWYRI